jgi:glycosyltransferase involved in cell wall biosynthesis
MSSPPSTPLRVLHVAFSDRVSGSSRYICDLAVRQSRGGHQVGITLPARGQGVSIYDSLPDGVEVISALGSPGVFGLARAIGDFKPDILHFHDGRGPRAARWIPGRPPSVATLHLGYKKAMAHADVLIRIGEWQDVSAYRGPVIDIPNWRTASPPVPPEQALALRESVGAGKGGFLLGCVGRLHPSKGADVLVDAFRRTSAPHAILVFIGDGPERTALKARAAGDPRIRFLGLRTDVDAWYSALDAFVTPSYAEHSPLVVLEAMSAGLPIAASANPGSAEMLRGQPAPLFPPGDVDALARILAGWVTAPPSRVRYDLSRFDPNRAGALIEGSYAQAIAAQGARRRRS